MTDSASKSLQAYCFKCRTKRDIRDPQAIYNKAGAPATRGQCPECGTSMYRTGATAAHEGVPKPEKSQRTVRQQTKPKRGRKSKARTKRKNRAKSNGIRRNVGKLVIVESPAKARSIGGYLGDGYTVMSSLGHVRDLLKSRLSVDVERDFEPEYRVPNDKRAIVKELKAAAEGADEIYLATDPDREGEAIAWHLVAAAEMPQAGVKRVVFNEITNSAVADAFTRPRDINMDLVNAQQARRILDRLVGYQVSQLLWSKVRGGLSAGRVQSIALRLVVEREKAIEAHRPVEYWTLDAELAKQTNGSDTSSFTARLVRISDQNVIFDPKGETPPVLDSEATIQPHVDILRQSQYVVDAVKRGTRQSRPSAPFTTSTLQQAASSRRGFSARRTMQIAQQLYEGIDIGQGSPVGLITYMRTDSVQVSKGAVAEARKYIDRNHGADYLPKKPPVYKTKSKGAQEAHEAIRPTSVSRTPEAMKAALSRPQLQLYTLIWQRFVASQMSPAIYDTLRIDVRAGQTAGDMRYLFRASGSKLKFAGHLAIYGKDELRARDLGNDQNQTFPALETGESLDLRQLRPEQNFTKPPPRYTEATLIKQLEDRGIGRPSTYAPTVSVIQARDYVTQKDRRLLPTKTGRVVSDLLSEYFDVEMDYAFTANMEDQLDDVSKGMLEWRPMLDEFYHPFERRLAVAQEKMPKQNVVEKVGRVCPRCEEGDLIIKHSRYGKFIGCSNYPDCKHTERYLKRMGLLCPQCGADHRGEIVEKRSRKGRVFYGCSRYPDCDYTVWRLPKDLARLDEQTDQAAAKQESVF
ncbi:MAG: type I DNA topoisomerase [Chloroflexi bacterium]|nr:type I DNA topoisomerase [Chloroflexota bacterium]